MRSYYNRLPIGQSKGELHRIVAGLNEYNHSTEISDNHLSDMLDCLPVTDDCLLMKLNDKPNQEQSIFYNSQQDISGEIKHIIVDRSSNINEFRNVALVHDNKWHTWNLAHITKGVTPDLTTVERFPLNGLNLPNPDDVNAMPDGNFRKKESDMYVDSWANPEDYQKWTKTDNGITGINYNSSGDGKFRFTSDEQDKGLKISLPLETGKTYLFDLSFQGHCNLKMECEVSGSNVFSIDTREKPEHLMTIYTPATSIMHTFYVLENNSSGFYENVINFIQVIDISDTNFSSDQQVYDTYYKTKFIESDLNDREVYYSSAQFSRETDDFIFFSVSTSKRLYYISLNESDYVELPFYPKKIVTHLNRIFAIDTSNNLWWSSAGKFYEWEGGAYDHFLIMEKKKGFAGQYELIRIQNIFAGMPTNLFVESVDSADTVQGMSTSLNFSKDELFFYYLYTMQGNLANQALVGKSKYYNLAFGISSYTPNGGRDIVWIRSDAESEKPPEPFDASHYTFEEETSLTDLCVFNGNLYVFATNNIYVLRGSDISEFYVQRVVHGIGIKDYGSDFNQLLVSKNTAYFITNGNLYEFNGYDNPRLISHTTERHGGVDNFLYGGIKELTDNNFSLANDNDNVYLFRPYVTLITQDKHPINYYYQFHISTRTWWKHSGYQLDGDELDFIRVFAVEAVDGSCIHTFLSNYSIEHGYSFENYTEQVDMPVNGFNGGTEPFFITKAYNGSPSEDVTLTGLIIRLQGDSNKTSDIRLYYSLSSEGKDSFVLFKEFRDYKFTGDIEDVHIPLPIRLISNKSYYRLKVAIDNEMKVYNIERRVRTKGFSR